MPSFLPTKLYPPESTLLVPTFETGLEFFSEFENANLKKAIRVTDTEYQLLLSEDYNTTGHFHWFYFQTKTHFSANTSVVFKIINMLKQASLYSCGFKPFVYSTKKFKEKGIGWHPAGKNISYKRNNILYKKDSANTEQTEKNFHYTLEWEYIYEYANDVVFFAQFPPYTYSDLLKQLKEISSKNEFVRVNKLCKTLSKNSCPMITITDNIESYLLYGYEKLISSKSTSTKSMVLSRVDKLRNRLLLKQAAGKFKRTRKRNRTKDDNAGQSEDNNLNFSNLADLVEPEYIKDHEIEGIYHFKRIVALLKHQEDHGFKKGVFLTARVHPGNGLL